MKRILFFLLGLTGALFASAALADMEVTVPVTIQLPTENVDGSPLVDLNSIEIHSGTATRAYNDMIILTPVTAAPAPGETITFQYTTIVPNNSTLYISAKAVDNEGNVSAWGNEVAKGPFVQVDDIAPNAPGVTAGDAVILNCPPGWRCSTGQ